MNTPHSQITRRRFVGQLAAGAATIMLSPNVDAAAAEPEQKKLGVALVGLGTYSTGQLAPALRAAKHCRLAGVVTGDRAKGISWARNHGFPETSVYHYDTMHEMAGNPDISIVYVVTPNSLHAKHTIAAAKAGKHVICEKPMAVSVAECDAMIAACQAARVKLSIGYRLHFDPYHCELMRLAKERDFGTFERMHGAFAFRVSAQRPSWWRAQKALAGGGPLMDLGIYIVQASCMAVGGPTTGGGSLAAPVAVTAREGEKTRPDLFPDVEETIEWTLEFANGVTAAGRTSYQQSGNDFRAEAARGWIEIAPAYSYNGLRARTSRGELRFEPVNQQALQMDDFALCVRHGRESRVAGEMGRRDMAIIEAIYEAAASGRKVELRDGVGMRG